MIRDVPKTLLRITLGYAALWVIALLLWRGGEWLLWWLEAIVFTASLPLGVAWLVWLRQRGARNAAEGVPYSALSSVLCLLSSSLHHLRLTHSEGPPPDAAGRHAGRAARWHQRQ
jgi:hypothetical protein